VDAPDESQAEYPCKNVIQPFHVAGFLFTHGCKGRRSSSTPAWNFILPVQ
jgi:hypothetical protein